MDQARQGLLSPLLRQRRIRAARPHLHGSVLDFGCGSGALARFISPKSYVGVDRDPESIRIARQRFPEHCFIGALPDGRRFDCVAALAIIEHLTQPADVMEQLRCLLNPGGTVVLTTPHRAFDRLHTFSALIGLLSPEAADEHQHLFDRARLAAVAASAGYEIRLYRRFLLGINQLCVMERSS